ncbi:MAG TPA: hypothetical protein VJR70_05520, partial [Stellaceae bacterium]|nr:hypothetical protein [Stellaceae bacterium]
THSDLITELSPGIEITGESPRLRGTLDYSPTQYLFALNPSQNILGHNLYANGTATIAPELLFLDVHAFASLQPITPGLSTDLSSFGAATGATGLSPLAPGNLLVPTVVPKAQLTQVTTVIAAPYVQRRFGDYGVGELRYTFADNNFGGGQSLLLPAGATPLPATTDLTNEATATFVTGSYFDRFTSQFLLDSSRTTSNNLLDNSRQNRAIVATEVPLAHRVSALTTIGYEDLRFGGIPPVNINDAVWGVGFRLAATPDRNLIVLYGRHEGITAPYASLNYALTPLTRVTASYSDGLSTFSEEIEQNLAASGLTARGQTIDTRTLLPLTIHNPLLGIQLSLLRIKRASAAGYIDTKREHLSLGVDREEDIVIAQAAPGTGVSLRATTINFGWAHDINPLTTTQLALGYSWVTLLQDQTVDERLFTAGASISYLFNPTLTGTASYTFVNRDANQPLFKLNSNVVLVSLRKTF